jgi:hypothetical protein
MQGIQYAAAYRFNHRRLWNTDRPPQRAIAHKADDDSRKYSRDAMRPEFCKKTFALET